MISAFARGYQVLKEPRYLRAAERSAAFIVNHLYDGDTGLLSRRYRDGEVKHEANLDDYAFVSQGLLDLYEATFDAKWISLALKIADTQIALFWDSGPGGFFDTSGRDRSLLVRLKEQYDGAEPTGNALAAMTLLRLAEVTDNKRLREKAERTLLAFGTLLQNQPEVMPQMVAAYEFSTANTTQIVVASAKDDPARQDILNQVHARYLPNKILVLLDGSESQERLSEMNPFYASIPVVENRTRVYVCRHHVCRLPVSDADALAGILDEKK